MAGILTLEDVFERTIKEQVLDESDEANSTVRGQLKIAQRLSRLRVLATERMRVRKATMQPLGASNVRGAMFERRRSQMDLLGNANGGQGNGEAKHNGKRTRRSLEGVFDEPPGAPPPPGASTLNEPLLKVTVSEDAIM